jgi:hypothetical protein
MGFYVLLFLKITFRGQWHSQGVAIAQYRTILIAVHVRRLIKYWKVEQYIREIAQRKRASLLLVKDDEFLFNKYWLL